MKAKVFKILLVSGLCLLFLIIAFTLSFQSRAVQKMLVREVSTLLSKEFDTRVSVDAVYFYLPRTLEVHDAFIADQKDDTLFYINRVQAELQVFDNSRHFVSFDDLKIDGAVVNFGSHLGDSVANYDFFFSYFEPKQARDTTKPKIVWTIAFNQLELNNSSFAYFEENDTVTGRSFRENDFRFNNINGSFADFSIVDDSLSFRVNDLSLEEKNSFTVLAFQADARIHWKGMSFDNMKLQTPNSFLTDHFSFTYDHWRSFQDFNNSVWMEGHLNQSKVSFRDVAYFSDELKGWDQEVNIKGIVKGTLASLKGTGVELSSLENTYFNGDFSLKGLPEIDETYIDLDINKAQTNKEEIARLAMTDIPEELKKLGLIQFEGQYIGFLSDFVAFGSFHTALGDVRSDINMKLSNTGIDRYSGSLALLDFDLGKLINEPEILQKVKFSGNVDGKGLTLEEVTAEFKGQMDYIGVYGYNYRDISLNGKIFDKAFSGALQVNDKNLKFNFDGNILLDNRVPEFDFVATVDYANLKGLGIDTINPTTLKAELDIDFRGSDIDKMEGNVNINNLKLVRNNRTLELDSFSVESGLIDGKRELYVFSEVMDAQLKGRFQLTQLANSFNNYLARLLPNTLKLEQVPISRQEFEFVINLKETKEIISVFAENVWVDKGYLAGSYDSHINKMKLDVDAANIHYDKYDFTGIKFNAYPERGDTGQVIFDLKAPSIKLNDSSIAENLVLKLNVAKEKVDYRLAMGSRLTGSSLNMLGRILFTDSTATVHFTDAAMVIDSIKWNISDSSKLVLKDWKALEINNFVIRHREEFVRADGNLGGNDNDFVSLDFSRFNLAVVNPFLFANSQTRIGGTVNGDFHLYGFSNDVPVFDTDIRINKLSVGSDTLGDLSLGAVLNEKHKLVTVNGKMLSGRLKDLAITGFVQTNKSKEPLNLLITMQPTRLDVFQPFVNDLVSSLEGTGEARIRISGNLKDPEINGSANLTNAGFTVDYLKTRYFLNSRITVNKEKIDLGSFVVKDQNGGTARAQGYVGHRNFSEFTLNIVLDNMKDFLCLNTKLEDNDLYYGTAVVSGTARFTGTPENLHIYAKARTGKSTSLNVPLENAGEAGDYNFIHFVNFDEPRTRLTYQDLSGITLDFDLEITPDAEVQLIFDSKLGDIIKARGYSPSLRLRINSNGDFRMNGVYTIEQGDYLFTAVSLINKKFIIRKGGSITWTGDPMNANIDLVAAYRTKASPDNLVAGLVSASELEAYKQRIDVEAVMKLKGALTSPEIRFGINLPNVNTLSVGSRVNTSTLLNVIRRIENDQEEMTRQVFSLLVANMFIKPSINNNQSTYDPDVQSGLLSSSVGDLLSNQISNWMNQLNWKWNLGVNYVFGDNKVNQSEFIISASRKVLNDRLEFYTDVATGGTYSNVSFTYSITPDGNLRARAFNRNGIMQNYDFTTQVDRDRNINTTGLGLFYRTEFDLLSPERRKIRKMMERQK